MDLTSALAILAASYSKEADPIVTRNGVKPPKVAKEKGKVGRPRKNSGEEKAPVAKHKTGEAIFGLSLPEKGSLNAQQFMADIRSAGKRPNEHGIPVFHPLMVRDDTIKAIAGFLGYDTRASFAMQEMAARAEAMRQLGIARTNGKTRQEERSALRSLQGFTAGACDQHAKRIANLKAQEIQLAEEIITLTATLEGTSASPSELETAQSLLSITTSRLDQVQIDLTMMEAGQMKLADPFTGR